MRIFDYLFPLLTLISAFCFQSLPAIGQESTLKSPNVSANALFLYQDTPSGRDTLSTEPNGIDIEEAELAFYSDVDPYTRLNILLSLHPEYEMDGNSVTKSFQLEPEELYAESNQVPGVTIKLGKFKAFFGKHNYLHTHVFPLIKAPLVNEKLLEKEGLNDVGLSASWLIPTDWYNELTLQVLRGDGENNEFRSPRPQDNVGLVHWKNFFDLSDALTAEIGGSFAQGKNSLLGMTTLKGVDLTFKYRPVVGGKYHSWALGGEWIQRVLEQPESANEQGEGWNIWGKFQFAERWATLARYDYFHSSGGDLSVNGNALSDGSSNRKSLALVFAATEFSSYQLEYNRNQEQPLSSDENNKDENAWFLRANYTIGAHPAHAY